MKRINLLAAGALLVLLTAQARAQLVLPSSISAGATSNINQVVDVSRQNVLGVVVTFKQLAASSNGVQTLTWSWSPDKVNWTTATKTVGLTPNGTNSVSVLTNLPTHGALYMRLNSWQNGDSGTVTTNMTVVPMRKDGATASTSTELENIPNPTNAPAANFVLAATSASSSAWLPATQVTGGPITLDPDNLILNIADPLLTVLLDTDNIALYSY